MNKPADHNVIAVQNYGRSGSLFLQSLLDGHPDLLCLPALYSRDFFYFWENQNCKDLDGLINTFIDKHAYWFSPKGAPKLWGLDQMGPDMKDSVFLATDEFREGLRARLRESGLPSRRNFFTAVFETYAAIRSKTLSHSETIIFPIHSLPKRHIGYLLEDFSDARFIYTVRNPLRNLGSLINHNMRGDSHLNPVECSLAQLLNDTGKYWGLFHSYRLFGDRPHFVKCFDNSVAVRLEDLHSDLKVIMTKLCGWIGIPWNDCLLESTFDGMKWWNMPGSIRVSGTSKEIVSQKHSGIISDFDKTRLFCLFARHSEAWQYEYPEKSADFAQRFLTFFTLFFPLRSEISVLKWRIDKALNAIPFIFTRRLKKVIPRIAVLIPPMKLFVFLFSPFIIGLLILKDYTFIRIELFLGWIKLFNPRLRLTKLLF
ncbi:MAG: sulfotransferase [Elusimicrobiota bacterium]